MAAYKFSPIKTNSEMENVIMQLRLRQLPLTLEVINGIRVAIQSPHLDEKLYKTLEREFSGQWKEIQKKNNLDEWSKNQWGKELKKKNAIKSFFVPSRYNNSDIIKKETKIQKLSSKLKQIPPKLKEIGPKLKKITSKNLKKNKNRVWNDETRIIPQWKFPIKIEIPLVISSISQIDEILDDLRKYPKSITYDLTHDIASRIHERKVFDYYKEELGLIRKNLEFDEKKKQQARETVVLNRVGKVGTKLRKGADTFVITKASERDSLYDNFEYGLSDWDK